MLRFSLKFKFLAQGQAPDEQPNQALSLFKGARRSGKSFLMYQNIGKFQKRRLILLQIGYAKNFSKRTLREPFVLFW